VKYLLLAFVRTATPTSESLAVECSDWAAMQTTDKLSAVSQTLYSSVQLLPVLLSCKTTHNFSIQCSCSVTRASACPARQAWQCRMQHIRSSLPLMSINITSSHYFTDNSALGSNPQLTELNRTISWLVSKPQRPIQCAVTLYPRRKAFGNG